MNIFELLKNNLHYINIFFSFVYHRGCRNVCVRAIGTRETRGQMGRDCVHFMNIQITDCNYSFLLNLSFIYLSRYRIYSLLIIFLFLLHCFFVLNFCFFLHIKTSRNFFLVFQIANRKTMFTFLAFGNCCLCVCVCDPYTQRYKFVAYLFICLLIFFCFSFVFVKYNRFQHIIFFLFYVYLYISIYI